MRIDRDQMRVGLILTLLAVAFVFVAWRPTHVSADRLRLEITRHQAQLGLVQNESRDLVRLAKDVDELRESLSGAQQYIPTETELADLLRGMNQILDAQDVSDKELQTKAVVRGADYNVMPVDLQFTGSFAAVYSFIRRLEDMPRLIRIDRLEVHRNRDRGRDDGSADRLRIRMELSTFFSDASDAAKGTR